jgi:hypothetical protein
MIYNTIIVEIAGHVLFSLKKYDDLLLCSYRHVIFLNISSVMGHFHYFVKSLFSLLYNFLVLTL